MAITQSNIVDLSKLSGPEAQRDEILKTLGDLGQYELLDEECLVATYVESNVLSEGKREDGSSYKLISTENRAAESRFQGKAVLLVKKGPSAFRFHNNGQPYEGVVPEDGEWVVIHPSDGREIYLRGMDSGSGKGAACRRVHWRSIFMRVRDPRVVH
jgi:hypothetical protein